MSFVLNFPLFMIVSCLFSSVLSNILHPKTARNLTLCLTFTITVLNVIILGYVMGQGQTFTYMMGHFPHPWGNELRIGTIEALFAAIFAFVLFLTLLGGKQSINEGIRSDKGNLYYALCDLVMSCLLVLVYTNDIFTGYVFVEICTLASCGILMIRDNGQTIAAAIRYMVFALIGSGLFLFGIVFLYNITGNLLIPDLNESVLALWESGQYRLPLLAAMCFISIGLAIKSGLFPFHFWMADTYGEAVPASSGILSGVISKAYIFLLIKIIRDVFTVEIFQASGISNIIFVMAICGVVMGSVSATRENNISKMIAYSSAAQIGYIYMGIGLSTNAALTASLFQIAAHAITKPALFLASYRLSFVSAGAKKFKHIQGASRRDPFAAICFTQGALSMVGIPLTAGFITKFLFGTAAFGHGGLKLVLTLVTLIISTVLNTIYFTKTIIRIYTSTEHDIQVPVRAEYAVSGVLFMIINFALGIMSSSIIGIITEGILLF